MTSKKTKFAKRSPTQLFMQLAGVLSKVNGASFISIDTLTDVPLRGGQKNPLRGRVQKMSVGCNVMVFQNKFTNGYENMVQNRLIAEGKDPTSFELQERAWGERLPDMPFVKHGDQYYLEVIFLRPPLQVGYLVDGEPFFGEIEGLPESKEESEQGGLSNKVIIRSYKVTSIVSITVGKKTTVLQ